MFISDTDIVSNPTFTKPIPQVARFLDWMGSDLLISWPTSVELKYGVELLRGRNAEKASRLEAWADALIARSDRLGFHPELPRTYAEMLSWKELNDLWMSNGTPRRPRLNMDLLIAAIAKVHAMPIATTNTRDFIKITRCFDLIGIHDPETGVWTSTTGNKPPSGLPDAA
jgi:toxin FitB